VSLVTREKPEKRPKVANSVDAKGVTSEWTNLNTLFGIPVGTPVLIQVVIGHNQDLMELWFGDDEPTTERGEVIKQYDPAYRVAAGESAIWGRYFVPSRDVNEYTANKTTRVSMRVVSTETVTEAARSKFIERQLSAQSDILSNILLELKILNYLKAESQSENLESLRRGIEHAN